MNEPIKIRAAPAPWYSGVELLVKQGKSVGISVQMQAAPESAVMEPTLRISNNEAQTLMDDLWNAGLRPTEGTGTAGALKATEVHLADMRRIAFDALKISQIRYSPLPKEADQA